MTFYKTQKQYRIVELASKDSDQKIRVHYQIQKLKSYFFGLYRRWVYLTEMYSPDGATRPIEFYYKDRAIQYVNDLRAPLPKDKYTYM